MIVIIGGGLAGLSTAYHLGDEPHLVLEGEATPGGLCRTREIDGFFFDYTGHLLHLRDPRAVALIERMLPEAFGTITRRATIRSCGATLPFPFQANLHGLPPETIADCVLGFIESLDSEVPEDPGTSFEEWALSVFGPGICDAFMFPYNRKLFRRDPGQMTADWVSWAVPKPTLEEVVRGAAGIENGGMGYNSTFRYPRHGGIDAIVDAFAERVDRVRYGSRVVGVDLDARRVELSDGSDVAYDELVVTCPLPQLLSMVRGSDVEDYPELAERLDWSVVGCLNLGVERAEIADGAHWIYFPDDGVPFYRAGFPTNFSGAVAPPGTSSLYVEFGLERGPLPDRTLLEEAAVAALCREGLLAPQDRILVKDWAFIDPGYVIFDRDRQRVLERVVPELRGRGVHPIGRYGAWTYSYMERAILDGLELAESLRQRVGV